MLAPSSHRTGLGQVFRGDPRVFPAPFAWLVVFFGYLLIAFLFHAAGLNLFSQLLGGGDGFTAGLPSKLFATQLSPWNPYVQLGQYSFANTQFQPFYPPALLIMTLFPSTFGYNLFILCHYAFAGLFFYFFSRNLRISNYAAWVGGLIFMLSGFLSAHKGHQAMMSAAVWLPLMLFFVDRYISSRRPRELAFASGALAMSILAGFPQITLYSMAVVAAYTVFRLRSRSEMVWGAVIRHAAFALGVVTVLSLLLSSLQLFAVAEALPQMTREKLTYGAFSDDYLPVYHLFGFVVPNLLGGFFHIPTYSAEINVVEAYPYIGLLPFALALLAFRYRKNSSRETSFWAAVAAVALLLALGRLTPLNALLFHVPVYNLFRAPARHLFEAHFAIAVMAAIALDLILRPDPAARLVRSVRGTSTLLAVIIVSVYGISQIVRVAAGWLALPPFREVNKLPANAMISIAGATDAVAKNLDPSHPTLVYPCLFAVIAFVVLRLYAAGRYRKILNAVVPVVIAIDMYLPYSTLYGNPDTSSLGRPEARPETAFLNAQQFDRDAYRIFPVGQDISSTYPLLNMTYKWNAVNDYTPMWLKRYVAMTGFELNGVMPPENLVNPNVFSAAGAKYLIARAGMFLDPIRTAQTVGPTTVKPLFSNGAMISDHAIPSGNGSYSLRSPDGIGVSLLQAPIPIRKSTRYQIAFDARAPVGLSKPLLVNLYNGTAGYDSPAQYKVLAQLPVVASRQAIVIDSGPQAPQEGFVRIFTQSRDPIEIGNVTIGVQVVSEGSLAPLAKVYEQVYTGSDGIIIFRNTRALPRFRFVTTLRPCKDVLEARSILDGDPTFDVQSQALVEGIPERVTVNEGSVLSRNIGNNTMRFSLKTGARSFFVIADSWFPGWKATVDTKDTRIYVVDGFLRGMLIDGAGTHEVEMSYHPWSVPAGLLATLLGISFVAFVCWRGDRVAVRIAGWLDGKRELPG